MGHRPMHLGPMHRSYATVPEMQLLAFACNPIDQDLILSMFCSSLVHVLKSIAVILVPTDVPLLATYVGMVVESCGHVMECISL